MKRLLPVLPAVLVFCAAWLFFLMLAPWGNVHRDEGWLLESTWRVSRGEIPHLDFSTIYPAGRYYLMAWWMNVTDTTLLAVRTMHATLRALTVVLVWSIGRRWMPWPLALMAAISATLVPGPWHKTLYVLVPLAVVRAWQLWLDHPSRWTAALTGAVAGIGFWFRQDTAAFAALAIGAVLGLRALQAEGRRQELEGMAAMVAAGLVTFLLGLAFFSVGPGPSVVLDEVLFAAFSDGAPEAGVMTGILLGDLERYGARGLMVLTGASLAAALVTLSGFGAGLVALRDPRHRRVASQLLVISLLYALMANQIFRGNAFTRFLQAVPPFYLLWFAGASLEASTLLDRTAAWWRRAGAAILVLAAALGPAGLFYACMPVRGQTMITPEFSGTMVTMWERRHAYSVDNITFYGDPMEMDRVLLMIHEIRGTIDARDTVLLVPGPSMAYVLSNRPNPSRFVRWVPDTPDRLEEFAEMLKSEDVEWVVIDEVFLRRASPAWHSVLSRYARKVRTIDRHEVWKVLTTVTVIIPSFEAADTLGRAIEAVLPQLQPGDELLILDDGSTDATPEVASSHEGVRLVSLERNRGVAFARNEAAEAARGELLIFTDADAALKPDVVDKMRERMSAPEAPGALVGLYAPECFAEGAVSRFKNLWIRNTYLRAAPDIDFVFGCIFAVTRETYLAVGGMDTDFQRNTGGGDIELGLRIRRHGLPIRLDTDLQAIHGRSFTVFELMQNDYRRASGYSRLGVDTHGVSGIASRARFANIPPTYLVGTAMVGLGLASLVLLPVVPGAGVGLMTAVVVHTVVSMPVYAFMAREGDVGLALATPALLAASQLAAGFGVVRGLLRKWVA